MVELVEPICFARSEEQKLSSICPEWPFW